QTASQMQILYSSLLTILTNKLPVDVFGFNPDSTGLCRLDTVHIHPAITAAPAAPAQVVVSGNCISASNPGQPFMLNGLKQNFQMNCTFAPPQNTSNYKVYGTVVPRAGTITQLVARQIILPGVGDVGGGTVHVWINPNS